MWRVVQVERKTTKTHDQMISLVPRTFGPEIQPTKSSPMARWNSDGRWSREVSANSSGVESLKGNDQSGESLEVLVSLLTNVDEAADSATVSAAA